MNMAFRQGRHKNLSPGGLGIFCTAMRNRFFCALLLLTALSAAAAERVFDFSAVKEGEIPPGFRSSVNGKGKPGKWEVIQDEVPPMLAPLTPNAPAVAKRPVLAQMAQDPTDEHFPLLIYQDETFDDFTITTRFKTVKGVIEQMAGIAFRLQDETNFYVVRASALGNNFRFYKVVNGERATPIGPTVPIPSGVWHELGIECKGAQIHCKLDGKEIIPMLTDNTFARGKIAFWTKSDSVTYFTDAKINYTRRDPAAQTILRDVLKAYPRLLGLDIFVPGDDPAKPRLLASKDKTKMGQFGGKVEGDVITRSVSYFAKQKGSVEVTLPIRDRNGDTVAAARIIMRTFLGQTEQNAVERAAPIAKDIEGRISSLNELVQ